MLAMGSQQIVAMIEAGRLDAIVTPEGCFLTDADVRRLANERAALSHGARPPATPGYISRFGPSATWLPPHRPRH